MGRKMQMGAPLIPSDKRIAPKPRWLVVLQDRSLIVFEIAVFLFLVVLGYLLYGVVSGQLLTVHNLPQKDQLRVMANLAMAGKALWWTLVIWVIALCVRNYQDESLGYLLLFLAAGLYYGLPIFLAYMVDSRGLRPNGAVIELASQLRFAALPVIVIGMMFVAADLVKRIQVSFERTRYRIRSEPILKGSEEQAEPRRSSLLGKCWQLPFCEKYIRERCPRYLERVACWRKKSGCMCDETIVLKAMIIDTANQATAEKMASLFVGKTSNSAAKRGKARCAVCPIFLEHQRQKHRLISPLAFPLVGVLFYEYLPYLRAMYHGALVWMDRFVASLSFQASSSLQGHTRVITDIANSAPVEWVVLLCAATLAITIMLQVVDLVVLKWKV